MHGVRGWQWHLLLVRLREHGPGVLLLCVVGEALREQMRWALVPVCCCMVRGATFSNVLLLATLTVTIGL